MKTRTTNQEACPKHQKQVHEKKRQNILWKQRNISNKFEVKKRIAFRDYATRTISAYNVEIDKKVGSGLLDEEKADNMKEELLLTKEETEPEEEVEGLKKITPKTGGIQSHYSP